MLLVVLLFAASAGAQNASVSIYTQSRQYTYFGCYNETTDIEGSTNSRALSGGVNEVRKGEMTVPLCLDFCATANGTYRYAGLEWSRECWCAQSISGISTKLDEGQCNFPCEGNTTMACGGALKLSVYKLSRAASSEAVSWTILLVAVMTLLLAL